MCALRLCSVITSAACNVTKIRDPEVALDARGVMKERIRRVLHMAAAEHVDVLILGAWGCGVFGNSAYQMAALFRQVLEDSKFRHIRCIFAIPDEEMRRIFQSTFSGKEDQVSGQEQSRD